MAPRQPAASMQQLSTTSLDVLEQQIASGELSDDLRTVFGEGGAAELEQMAQSGTDLTLGPDDRPVVVLLPGITGSTLMNTTGDAGMIWVNPLALVAGKLALLQLDPSGERDRPGVRVVPVGLLPTHYLLMQMHLKTFGGCDVYSFPFDWRRPPALAAEILRQFVADLHHQTGRKVHLVGHSMGGLVARRYCSSHRDEATEHVAQVVQLGTPNYGSFSALQTLLSAEGLVGMIQKINAANDPLAFTRSCPGIYAMLPAPREIYPADAPFAYPYTADGDVYSYDFYNTPGLSKTHLQAAKSAYSALQDEEPLPVPVTIIAGYDLPTAVGIAVERAGGTATFRFGGVGDGDGTVPLASVMALPGAQRYYGRGLKHGDLPLYGAVRDAVIALVHGRAITTLASEPYAQTLGEGDEPALTLSVPEAPTATELDESTVDAIAARVRAGEATPGDLRALVLL